MQRDSGGCVDAQTHLHLFPQIEPKMNEMATALFENVDVRRICSVFAPKPICIAFCNVWTRLTGIPLETNPNPYHDELVSYCTPQTLKTTNRRPLAGHEHEIRLAVASDALNMTALCQSFSEESVSHPISIMLDIYIYTLLTFLLQEPFVLDQRGAEREARYLIDNGLVWVYMARESSGDEFEIASILACTRNTEKVGTITKVYTQRQWRRRGCVERLVRHVCTK